MIGFQAEQSWDEMEAADEKARQQEAADKQAALLEHTEAERKITARQEIDLKAVLAQEVPEDSANIRADAEADTQADSQDDTHANTHVNTHANTHADTQVSTQGIQQSSTTPPMPSHSGEAHQATPAADENSAADARRSSLKQSSSQLGRLREAKARRSFTSMPDDFHPGAGNGSTEKGLRHFLAEDLVLEENNVLPSAVKKAQAVGGVAVAAKTAIVEHAPQFEDDDGASATNYLRPVLGQPEVYDQAQGSNSSDPAMISRPLPATEGYVAGGEADNGAGGQADNDEADNKTDGEAANIATIDTSGGAKLGLRLTKVPGTVRGAVVKGCDAGSLADASG